MTDRMIEVLKLMACSASQQRAAFPDFVVVADEIALLFDDELRLVDMSTLPPAVGDALRSIDSRLSDMSNDKSIWSLEALATSHEWQQLRGAALALLSTLGVPPGPADLSWGTYVRGARPMTAEDQVEAEVPIAREAFRRGIPPSQIVEPLVRRGWGTIMLILLGRNAFNLSLQECKGAEGWSQKGLDAAKFDAYLVPLIESRRALWDR